MLEREPRLPRKTCPKGRTSTQLQVIGAMWNESFVLLDFPAFWSRGWISIKISNFQSLSQAKRQVSRGCIQPGECLTWSVFLEKSSDLGIISAECTTHLPLSACGVLDK